MLNTLFQYLFFKDQDLKKKWIYIYNSMCLADLTPVEVNKIRKLEKKDIYYIY